MGLAILISYLKRKWNIISANGTMSRSVVSSINNILLFNIAPNERKNYFVDSYYGNIKYSAIVKIVWMIPFVVLMFLIKIIWIKQTLLILYFITVITENSYYLKRKKMFINIINEHNGYAEILNNVKDAYHALLWYQRYLYVIMFAVFIVATFVLG